MNKKGKKGKDTKRQRRWGSDGIRGGGLPQAHTGQKTHSNDLNY